MNEPTAGKEAVDRFGGRGREMNVNDSGLTAVPLTTNARWKVSQEANIFANFASANNTALDAVQLHFFLVTYQVLDGRR